MTPEQKDLLLKDLCARLPYNIKVYDNNGNFNTSYVNLLHINGKVSEAFVGNGMQCRTAPIDEIRPYLFPLSSMTEEQYNEMQTISGKDCMEHMEIEKEWRNNSPFTHLPLYQHRVIEFFHKYHFDYRGLIPMGLAIDATGLNIY